MCSRMPSRRTSMPLLLLATCVVLFFFPEGILSNRWQAPTLQGQETIKRRHNGRENPTRRCQKSKPQKPGVEIFLFGWTSVEDWCWIMEEFCTNLFQVGRIEVAGEMRSEVFFSKNEEQRWWSRCHIRRWERRKFWLGLTSLYIYFGLQVNVARWNFFNKTCLMKTLNPTPFLAKQIFGHNIQIREKIKFEHVRATSAALTQNSYT